MCGPLGVVSVAHKRFEKRIEAPFPRRRNTLGPLARRSTTPKVLRSERYEELENRRTIIIIEAHLPLLAAGPRRIPLIQMHPSRFLPFLPRVKRHPINE